MSQPAYSKGLEGVIADESSVSLVDGTAGKLYYRGYSIEDIVQKKHYDETSYLVLFGSFPTPAELKDYRAKLAANYELPPQIITWIKATPRETHPMEAIQALLAVIGNIDPTGIDVERQDAPGGGKRSVVTHLEEHRTELLALLAKIPTMVAYYHRHQSGQPFIPPRKDLNLMANFLYMFKGTPAPARDVEIFEICEILQMEHGFNASTFAARVVASTLAPIHTSLSAAVGALFGKLHGGADEAAFRMARDEIGGPEKAEKYVKETLAHGGKIMGMGHRVYKTVDPRATVLKGLAAELTASKGGDKERVLKTLFKVEEVMAEVMEGKGKEIYSNVEFYKGPVFNALDIPPEYYTSMFVIARAFGWGANILELWHDHRLYRPKAMYMGKTGLKVE
ncbi:MAG TPA: citrate/2-methylcitrate synthase [Planctomycetota bacterium]|nr:citrate/2-methylcitrate synthase [Planctomycetota bacterium]